VPYRNIALHATALPRSAWLSELFSTVQFAAGERAQRNTYNVASDRFACKIELLCHEAIVLDTYFSNMSFILLVLPRISIKHCKLAVGSAGPLTTQRTSHVHYGLFQSDAQVTLWFT
jgi:hypothetical protein